MRRAWKVCLAGVVLVVLAIQPALAQKVYEFKISVDTVMNHPRNQGLLIFMDMIKKRSNGRLAPKLYHSAQLYKDTHVPKALSLGTLEMGVPGIWQLESYDPNASITSLPMFFGQPAEVTEKLVDGEMGKAVAESLGKKIRVKVLGRWYELGYIHMHFIKKKVAKLEDFKGLKIRYFGSSVNAERIKAFGASPIMISWADVPMAMVQGTVDGLITSFKSAEGAKLNEAGMKYSVKYRESMLHYLPMVSLKFWSTLPEDLQKIMVDSWNEQVDQQREMARKMQAEAELILEKKGVEIFRPSDELLAKWRKHIMPAQEPFVKKIGMNTELVNIAKKMLGM
ncbi:MAG: TRAP transporter substrate-binding protein DctP [Deltaproteobacteria bacterium]|nr:TRAP transporter substrate-binding protein DctP [Deltaproteobacteria bacterium]